jgi:Peptidase family M23
MSSQRPLLLGGASVAATDRLDEVPTGAAAEAKTVQRSSLWVWPVPSLGGWRPVISEGWRRGRGLDGRLDRHPGVDIMYEREGPYDLEVAFPAGTPSGTRDHFMPDDIPALAASDGIVRLTRWSPRGFCIVIVHASGWTTCYAHLERITVVADEVVVAGQPIGFVGQDPAAARPVRHLHFELWQHGTRLSALDPGPYLAAWRYLTLTSWSPPTIRNARLVYRPVGRRGEPYPDWLRRLKGESGVYVIRQEGRTVYVGESHTGRLYDTLTRHFQTWRRWKGFWKGQFAEGHDPGLTYDRESVEVAVRITSASDAIDEEARLIERLRPRDNLLGQVDARSRFPSDQHRGGTLHAGASRSNPYGHRRGRHARTERSRGAGMPHDPDRTGSGSRQADRLAGRSITEPAHGYRSDAGPRRLDRASARGLAA